MERFCSAYYKCPSPHFLCSLLSFLLLIFSPPRFCLLLCLLSAPQTLPVQCDSLTYCGTLAAAGYCPKYLGNRALPASERMNQTFDLEAWKARMTTCIQILEGSSVPGCPLPRRTKSRKSVLNRPKGTKRDQPDAAAGGEVPTATCRRKRRCVNQAGPETAEITRPQPGRFQTVTARHRQYRSRSLALPIMSANVSSTKAKEILQRVWSRIVLLRYRTVSIGSAVARIRY